MVDEKKEWSLMVKVRQDAWSHEDDLLLAETVLRHIREGSTQLKAFEEVGDQLNRTSAACGFRWNAEVRNRYIQAIDIAKRQRKEKKRAMAGQQRTQVPAVSANASTQQEVNEIPTFSAQPQMEWDNHSQNQDAVPEQVREKAAEQEQEEEVTHYEEETVSFEQVIKSMRQLKQQYQASNQSKLNQLEQENQTLRREKDELENQVQQMNQKYNMIQEDYQVLMQIMDRARKMIVFDDEEQANAAKAFRMEKNGNLEQVARQA